MNMLEFGISQGSDNTWTIKAHVEQSSQDGLALATDTARHLRAVAAALDAFVAAESVPTSVRAARG